MLIAHNTPINVIYRDKCADGAPNRRQKRNEKTESGQINSKLNEIKKRGRDKRTDIRAKRTDTHTQTHCPHINIERTNKDNDDKETQGYFKV